MARLLDVAVTMAMRGRTVFLSALGLLLAFVLMTSTAHAQVVFTSLAVSATSGTVGANGTFTVTFSGTAKALDAGDAINQISILEGGASISNVPYSVTYNAKTGLPVNTTRTISNSVALTPGTHTLTVIGFTELGQDMESQSFVITVAGASPVNGATFVSQSVPSTMSAGEYYFVAVTFQNTGTSTWTSGGSQPYSLGSQNPANNLTWGWGRVVPPSSIAPGASATFYFTLRAPSTPGTYNFQWGMLQEGVQWFGELSPNVAVTVTAPPAVNGATYVSQSVPTTMVAGQNYSASVTMKNSGTTTWTPGGTNPFSLGAANPLNNSTWGLGRAALSTSVAPGATYTFAFTVKAPATAGSYNFQWQMVKELVEWFGAASPNVVVSVSQPLPPTVSLTSPANGTKYTTNSSTYTANLAGSAAAASGATITRLEFFDGTTSLGSTASTSLSLSKALALGSHSLELRATDSRGSVASAYSTISIGAPAPTATLSSPSNGTIYTIASGSTYSVPVIGSGTVASNTTLSKIEVLDNGTPVYTQTSGTSVSASVALRAGSHALQLRTTDKLNNSTTSATSTITVKAPAPTVTMAQPVDGAVVTTTGTTAAVTISGTAAPAASTTLSKVELLDNDAVIQSTTSATLSVSKSLSVGTHRLQLKATDSAGQAGYSPVANVTVVAITSGDSARFVSQSVPTTARTGQPYTFTVTMLNTGTTTWTEGTGYRLGSQNPQDNRTWGGRAYLSGSVASGQQGVFTITATAPQDPGTYNFQWQMLHEYVAWFGTKTDNVAVTVSTGAGPIATLGATPTNVRVAGSQTTAVTFTGSGTRSGGLVTKLELFQSSGTGYGATPIKTQTGSATTLNLSTTASLGAGVYSFKLRSTDSAGLQTESRPVFVNVTNSALLGSISGVRTNAADGTELFGWACQPNSATPLNYKVLLDAPSLEAGATLLTTGVANVKTEPDSGSVESQCGTPGTGHHFVVNLSSYIATYAGRRLYVWAETANAASTVSLPCGDNTCTMPGTLRVGLTTPANNDRYALPNPVFMRLQLTNATGTYDEVGFVVNGEYVIAQADGAAGAYSATKSGLSASATPYTVYAKVRQGNVTLMSVQKQFYVETAGSSTVALDGISSGASFPVGTTQVLRATSTGTSVQSLKFYGNGALLGTATRSGNNWSLSWNPSTAGSYSLLARAFDSNGTQLAESPAVMVTVAAASTSATPVPIAVTIPDFGNSVGGTLPGEVTVGADGSAGYNIPIQVPPGIQGMVPNIALSYSSNNPSGLAGLGWQISGISHIDRCGKVLATDGRGDAVRFLDKSSSLAALANPLPVDRLCLDGMRLILVNGTASNDASYWTDGAEYRTEVESFTRVTAQALNGKRVFKVETKDGRISYYGATADSYIEGTGRADGLAHRWYVNSTADRSGNLIDFTYDEDPVTGEAVPSTISWGGNTVSGTGHFAKVTFDYEKRADPRIAYIAGSRFDQRKRLTTITTNVDTSANGANPSTLALKYTLAYSVSPTSGRSRLDSVTVCDAGGCMPKTSFTWGEPASGSQKGFVALGGIRSGPDLGKLSSGNIYSFSLAQRFIAADFDGDGKTDLLERFGASGAGSQQLYISNANGSNWSKTPAFSTTVTRVLESGDFDGDGLLDLLVSTSSTQWAICFGKNRTASGNFVCGTSLALPSGVVKDDVPQLSLRVVRDFNADGKDDLFAFTDNPESFGTRGYQCLSNGSTFDCVDVTGTRSAIDMGQDRRGEPYGPSAFADVDGDGRVDNILISKCEFTTDPNRPNDPKRAWRCGSVVAPGQAGVIAFSQGEPGAVEVSGGWLDFPSLNTGVAIPMSYGTLVGDQNGDGYSDMVAGLVGLLTNGTVDVNQGSSSLCLSRGDGSADCRTLPSSGLIAGGTARSFMAMTVGDFNGDGVIDVLRPKDDNWNNANVAGYQLCRIGTDATSNTEELPLFQRCEEWTGPPFYAVAQNVAFNGDDPREPVPMSMFLGDFDGDGRQDIATYLGGDQWQIHSAAPQSNAGESLDRLIKVTNGLGHVERVDYALSNDQSVYKANVSRPDGQNTVGKLSAPGRPLVKAIHRDSGIAGQRDTSYSYARFAMDSQGRGALGFAELASTDVQRGVTTKNWPCLTFPHIGADCASTQVTTGGTELSSATNTWGTKLYTHASGGRTSQSYLKDSTVSRHDPNGNDLGKQVVSNGIPDDWGNIATTKTVSSPSNKTDGWTVNVTRTFDNDAATWRIGEVRALTESRTNDYNTISRTMAYTYDGAGLLKTETRDIADTTQRLETSYDRTGNKFGLVGKTKLSWTDPAKTAQTRIVSDVAYTANGRFVSSVTNAAQHKEERTFDARTGRPVTVTSPNGIATTMSSDGFGRALSVTTPDGNTVKTAYKRCDKNCPTGTGLIQIQESTRADGARSAVPVLQFADTSGRVVRQVTWGFDGAYIVASTLHDVFGRVQTVYWPRYVAGGSDALSSLSDIPASAKLQSAASYDILDRPLTQTSLGEDGGTLTTTHTWTGLTHKTTNSKTQSISETRDLWGKLATTDDANDKTTIFKFDAFGNLATTTDPVGNQVTVGYDTWGRRTKLIDPDLGTIAYDVDALGQTWKQVSPNERAANKSTAMTYDVLGRMTGRTAEGVSASWTFDVLPTQSDCKAAMSCGKLVRAATSAGTSALDYHQDFTFDALGRPDTTTRYLDVAYTSKLTYDTWGRLSSEQHQRGSATAKVYDRRYNAWGQLASIERLGVSIWKATVKDAAGRVTAATLGNGLALASVFDPNTGRLTDGTVKAGGTQRLHEAYQYDSLGNVSQRMQEWGSTAFIESFGYDNLNRLTSSQIVGQTEQVFTYDDIGNIKTKPLVGRYTYPAPGAPRPHAVSEVSSTGTFAYDDNGNMTRAPGRTMTWTSFDMPLKISKGAVDSTFYYGADHERVKQVRSDGMTLWYAGAMEAEVVGSAVKLKTYLPNSLGVEIESGGVTKLYYSHRDRLGSVMALSDEAGALSEQLAYDAWGKRREKATPSAPDSIDGQLDNKGFTGHEMLDALDLVHMNGRVYDPLIARFISADAIIQAPEHSQSYNRYAYVWNNPTNLTDPSGFAAQTPNQYADANGNCDKRCEQLNNDLARERSRGNPYYTNSQSKDSSGGNGSSANTVARGVIRDCAQETCVVNGKKYTSNFAIPGNEQVPVQDATGNVVLDSHGNPMYRPSRANLDTVVDQLTGSSAKIVEFRQGGSWDFQRVKDDSGRFIFTEKYREFANVAIGYGLASQGMDWVATSMIANTYAAFKSTYYEPMHPVFFALPKALIYDYKQGERMWNLDFGVSKPGTPMPVLKKTDYSGM